MSSLIWKSVYIKPIIFGGNPDDITNKCKITRKEHIQYVIFWNKKIRELNQRKLTTAST
jgi:hypothetical protein